MIKVHYMDHSGFVVVVPTAILVFDYYRDPAKVLRKELEANPDLPVVFFVTHHHADHFNPDIFDLAQNRDRTFVLSCDIESKHVIEKGMQVAYMTPGDTIENIAGSLLVRAFGSTDAGVSYVVQTPEGKTVFHAGDLNDWRWSEISDSREVARMDAEFEKIVNRIAEYYPELTVAMFPVDERQREDAQRGASIFMKKIKVDNFFPMHINGNADKACNFETYCPTPGVTKCYCLDRPGEHASV